MSLRDARPRRLAPRILVLCCALSCSRSAVSAISRKPPGKIAFIGSFNVNGGGLFAPAAPYSERLPHRHTRAAFPARSSPKDGLFADLPPPPGGGSLLARLWSGVKAYFAKKIPYSIAHAAFGRGAAAPEAYPRKTLVNPKSFFDFFNSPRATASDYRIRSDFDRTMSKESPYMELVRAGPAGIIKTFVRVAPKIVRDAVSLTVSTLIGSFYKYSAETTIITTTDRLAALILNLQLTGYIYCNAEQRYRLAALCGADERLPLPQPSLGDQMGTIPVGDELLSYVKRLPRAYINGIFDSMSPEILEAMRFSTEKTIQLLTESVVGQSYLDARDAHRLIIQQTGSFAMQLCFWKLALGYCLRDQETKIELSRSLNAR